MAREVAANRFLESLEVRTENRGACTGTWIDTEGAELVSYNPTNGEPVASVKQAVAEDYDRLLRHAAEEPSVDLEWELMQRELEARLKKLLWAIEHTTDENAELRDRLREEQRAVEDRLEGLLAR